MTVSNDFAPALAAFQRGDLDAARALAEGLLERAPSAAAEHLLGLVHCRRGDVDRGLRHLASAAEAEPGNAAYQLMLARASIDASRASEVLDLVEPPRDASPQSLALWQARAEAADAADRPDLAVECWQFITTARPRDGRVWNNLGNSLAAASRSDEAIAALRKAAALQPDEAHIRRNLAQALVRAGLVEDAIRQLNVAATLEPLDPGTFVALGEARAAIARHGEAIDAFGRAGALQAGQSAAMIGRARSLVAMTRFDEAEDAYRSALAADANDPQAALELGLLLDRTNRSDALEHLLADIATKGLQDERFAYLRAAAAFRAGHAGDAREALKDVDPGFDPERWNRLMAKACDALGDAEHAFAAADAMNRATPDFEGWRNSGAAYRRKLRQIAKGLTEGWAARLEPLPAPERPIPAFLVGFPRSGTTLLDTFLMGHPGTAVLEEMPMLGAAETVAGAASELPARSPAQLSQARDAYYAELDRHVPGDFAGVAIDKLPLNMLGMPLVHALFAGAPIVFAQRHPCDAVLSGLMQSFVMNEAMACFLTIEDAADLYDAAMSIWWRSQELLPLNVRRLVYEELVDDPRSALEPLVAFLGLEWHDDLLDHRSTAKARGAISTPSYDQVIQPISKAPVGRWKRYEDQLAPVLPVLLPWAERLGYTD